MTKNNITKKLAKLGWGWRNGIDKKQPVNDGLSPNAYQIVRIDDTLRAHYAYSLADLQSFLYRATRIA